MEAGDLALKLKVAPASISSSEDRSQKFAKAVDSLIATPLPEDIVAVTEMSSNDDTHKVLLVEPIKTINPSRIETSQKV